MMPLAYVVPEQAFVIKHQNGCSVPVYHCYKATHYPDPLVYWYTFDYQEDPQHDFDIRTLPTYDPDLRHDDIVALAFKRNLVELVGVRLTINPKPGDAS